MEQNQEGHVDLIEIYHARRMRDDIITQLRRLRESHDVGVLDFAHRHEAQRYYEALLLTVVELLHQMGDEELA